MCDLSVYLSREYNPMKHLKGVSISWYMDGARTLEQAWDSHGEGRSFLELPSAGFVSTIFFMSQPMLHGVWEGYGRGAIPNPLYKYVPASVNEQYLFFGRYS